MLRSIVLSIFFLFYWFSGVGTLAAPDLQPPPSPDSHDAVIYVIPVKGMIEPALTYVIRRGVLEAERDGASALVLEMDTPGGAVNATEEIIKILNRVRIPTYTLVEHNAISAGAIIALATDHIYMMPGSKIGDAMPIMAAPTGGVQPLPDAEREKITSYVDGIIRAAAEQNGHNPEVASAMVRRELELVIDGEVISKEGQLLTMTNVEAERRFGEDKKPLLSAGTVEDRSDFLETIGFKSARVVEMEITRMEQIARWIAAMAPIFMMGGMLGLYLEFKTPGFGIFGIAGLFCLLIFFFGHHIAGLAGMEDLLILAIGIILLVVELFVFPGFGVFGITGLALILVSLLNAMIEQLPGDPLLPSWPQMEVPFQKLGTSLGLSVVLGAILMRFLPRTSAFQKLVLQESTSTANGYTSAPDTSSLVGQQGVCLSDLRPSGIADINGRRVDVISHVGFVDRNTPIRVVQAHGSSVAVEPLSPK